MEFWQMAYNSKWVTINQLRIAVKTFANPYGAITPEKYEKITGEVF